MPTRYAELADPGMGLDRLLALPDAYDGWIQEHSDQAGVDAEDRSRDADLQAYRRESGYIRAGIELLKESRAAADALAAQGGAGSNSADLARRAAPWNAWMRTNETFAQYGGRKFTDWRLPHPDPRVADAGVRAPL